MHNFPWLLYISLLDSHDLYFRKNVICISLKEKKDKILYLKVLCHSISTDIASTLGKEQRESAPKQCLRWPHQTYNFPKPALMLGECLSLTHV